MVLITLDVHCTSHNKVDWKLVEGENFKELRTVLDNVMKECASNNIGLVSRQAEYISFEYKEKLMNDQILGEDTPD